MGKLYDLAAMTVASTGTGTITLGTAANINGVLFLSFAASGVQNSEVIDYSINDPAGASEIGTGTYTTAGTTLSRTVTKSTNSNTAINMSAAAIVRISPRAESLITLVGKQIFISTGTYTPTAGMLYCIIETVGSGGGGGSAAGTLANSYSGGGGGSGSYSRLVATAATIGASQTVTVASGGAGGASGSNNGASGGDVSVGTLCIGKGGSGGVFGSGAQFPLGGAGGVPGTGDITAAGVPGIPGVYNALSASVIIPSGAGGSSFFGGGAVGVFLLNGALAGNNASNYGSGGSGGSTSNTTSTAAGGNGSSGVVFITEYGRL